MEKITCPNCDHQFHLEGALAKQVESQFKKQLDEERSEMQKQQEQKAQVLAKKEKEFEAKRAKQNEIFKLQLEEKLAVEQVKLKEKINQDFELKLKSQQKELEESATKMQKYQQQEIEFAKMQRQMKDMEQEMQLKMQRQLNEEYQKIEEKAVKRASEENQMKLMEKEKMLEQQRKLIEEMKRKSEQGSMQLQGEVQELAIEEILKKEFPFDEILEVPKGVRGADTIQVVKNEAFQNCGTIIYESKRTKAFSKEWIEKLKIDQRNTKAEIAVLVTQTLPKDFKGYGEHHGVWICKFEDFESLSGVLRQILIRTNSIKGSQTNKGDKMVLLYSFLTSEEFKLQMTGIVEGWKTMKDELDREKRSIMTSWKRREKQLDIVIDNAVDMYGSIKGIAGNKLPNIEHLELPDSNPDQDI